MLAIKVSHTCQGRPVSTDKGRWIHMYINERIRLNDEYVNMIRDPEYGLVSGPAELEMLRRLNKEVGKVRVHRCNASGCRELVKTKYCDKHAQENAERYSEWQASQPVTARSKAETNLYDQTKRVELHDGFYHSKQWRKVSLYIKQRDGYRGAIDGKLYDDGELIVDHIVPRRLLKDRVAMLDADNLWLLNRRQHQIKTGIEKKIPDSKLKNLDKKFWIDKLKK